MRLDLRQIFVTAVLFSVIDPAAWGQTPGNSQLGVMNRLRDAARLRAESLASLKLTFADGTLSTTMDKYTPKVLFVRAKLDGEPVKLARGSKPKKVEGLSPGDLVVEVERPLNTTRQRTECAGYLFEGVQEVLIYPGGAEGVACKFVTVKASSEKLSEWERSLTFEQFEIVGRCLNDHEEDSPEYRECLEKSGVPLPPTE